MEEDITKLHNFTWIIFARSQTALTGLDFAYSALEAALRKEVHATMLELSYISSAKYSRLMALNAGPGALLRGIMNEFGELEMS